MVNPSPFYAPGFIAPGIAPVPISLTEYIQTTGINEYLFYGVKRGAYVPESTQFYDFWDRQMIYQYLRAAERQIENKIRVHLTPTWADEDGEEVIVADMRGYVSTSGRSGYYAWHDFAGAWPWSGSGSYYYNPTSLDWKAFIQAGQRKTSVYAAHATVSYGGDWAKVTVPSGGVGSKDEIRVFYADGTHTYGPEPSKIKVGPNNIIITWPKVRMVKPELSTRHNLPVDFDDNNNFVETITVAREYNDPSVQAVVRTRRNCNTTACQESTETACIFPSERELGYVAIYPACYGGGQWRRRTAFQGIPDVAFLHYQSGLKTLPPGWDQAIIRLAHTIMPEAPCPTGHQPQDRFWSRDRNMSHSQTRERINCPWGLMDGAWYSWMFFEEQEQNYSKGGGLLAFRG